MMRAKYARSASNAAWIYSVPTVWAWPIPGTMCVSAVRWAATNRKKRLRKGSIAIFSNSGNFTTTIANYLAIGGWGTTTLISSGKDVYINFAVPEFAYAMANDSRTKAAVMYSEPGGYYEESVTFEKPVVACVVGRWKANLTRAVGHAGAIAGSGDDARPKKNGSWTNSV